MFVPFSTISPSSRIWIFQGSRAFSADEQSLAEARLQQFCDEWAVHGNPFETSFAIRFNQFIVLAADESSQNASGCSIDSSVRVLKEIEGASGIDLFDRSQVAFMINDQVVVIPLKDVKQNFQKGILNEETLAFNNLVNTKEDFEKKWLVPAGETWLKRYMTNPLANVK